MTESCAAHRNDLLGTRWTLLLWVGPWMLIIIGGFTGNLVHKIGRAHV